jgi:hypothetical protein
MFDEPNEDRGAELPRNPADRAKDKSDEFRMHAELCAVFEAHRKFDAEIIPGLDADLARDAQRTIGRLEKSKPPDSPILPDSSAADAARVLNLPQTNDLSTNDFHIHRRPGEVMILRWIQADQVETFYARLQAHFDAALDQHREDERQSHGWKQDPNTQAYLAALDAMNVRMADRYLRDPIRKHNLFVLSSQSSDELDILHLSDLIVGVPAADLVGAASAPPDQPTERDRAWFFKLFSLRGMNKGVEQMCFFAFLQKADDGSDW